ncbi:hypothetical protein [Vibrio europaeus]|uniref:hypothetical protein n=1 Tax=Vibrio europaeus TaxID=300876 RepID=UPI00233EBDB5|nr:hypothetical protein [Vibrio europaeus]MDC5761024.1 hypothetical protein [Vibrio europaeus]
MAFASQRSYCLIPYILAGTHRAWKKPLPGVNDSIHSGFACSNLLPEGSVDFTLEPHPFPSFIGLPLTLIDHQ